VNEEIGAAGGALDGFEIGDAGTVEFDAVEQAFQVALLAGGKIVDDGDRFATAREFADDSRADEPGAASDQIPNGSPPGSFSAMLRRSRYNRSSRRKRIARL
jgi:hypothetical protein